MKKQDMLKAMNLIDEKYITEAGNAALYKRKKIKKIITLAACMTVLFALCLFLFVPYSTKAPGVNKYSKSEYYGVIEKLNQFFYEPPEFKNNFEAITYGLTSIFRAAKGTAPESSTDGIMDGNSGLLYGSADEVITSTSSSVSGKYEEVTDNQVKGVIEGDLFKRSDKYIYYLDGGTLRVYSIDGIKSAEVGKYVLQEYSYNADNIIYLSQDCTTVTVIYKDYLFSKKDGYRKSSFSVISLDVSDPTNIVKTKQIDYYGSFYSARLVDGKIYLVSGFIAKDTEDYTDKKNFVPYICEDGQTKYVSAEQIYAPEELSSASYTVLTKIDEKTLTVEAEYALLSFLNPVIYATKDSFYFARNYNDDWVEGEYTVYSDMTEICRIDYSGEGFSEVGTVTLKGNINDQYSLDEYNGMLRVFVSTDVTKRTSTLNGRYEMLNDGTGVNASFYCVDINTFKVAASVEYFAPKGENVKSARFDKNTAYVCTSVKFTDPVFFFDLSDMNNITYKETGTIEGYSTSLVDFGEGYLLGIGLKDWSTPKLEIYKEEGDKVVSVAAIGITDASISTAYKAYYIDREHGYIGLGATGYDYSTGIRNTRYIIFKFENEQLTVAYEMIVQGDVSCMRGTYIDGSVYVLTSGELNVIIESELQ